MRINHREREALCLILDEILPSTNLPVLTLDVGEDTTFLGRREAIDLRHLPPQAGSPISLAALIVGETKEPLERVFEDVQSVIVPNGLVAVVMPTKREPTERTTLKTVGIVHLRSIEYACRNVLKRNRGESRSRWMDTSTVPIHYPRPLYEICELFLQVGATPPHVKRLLDTSLFSIVWGYLRPLSVLREQ